MSNASGPLKPCPLCGKAAHFFKVDDLDSREHGGEGICCEATGCAQVGLMWSLKDDAKPLLAERWNRRAQAEPGTPWVGDPQNPPIEPSCCGGQESCDVREYCASAAMAEPREGSLPDRANPARDEAPKAIEPGGEATRPGERT